MQHLVAIACLAAAVCGFSATTALERRRMSNAQRRGAKAQMKAGSNASGKAEGSRGEPLAAAVLRAASRTSAPAWLRRASRVRLWRMGLADVQRGIDRAGFAGFATPEGVRIARMECSCIGMLGGALLGSVLSAELALLLGVLGLVGGFFWIPAELRRIAAERTADMERHLSEMVEVVVLGLRSGMSFERSFRLYPEYFDTELGRSMQRVVGLWEVGLVARDEAIRSLEREYDSTLLSRVVGSMTRSLRFGTSIADSLESAALEARESHRAFMEEKVAKVAVKMMLPVGTLILPAMLLLVLGPVLLELIQGF